VLAFFYDIKSEPWGYEPDHRGGARVFYFADADALVPGDKPEALDDIAIAERRMAFEEDLSLPSNETPVAEQLELDACEGYGETLAAEQSARGDVLHKVGGFADEVQGSMELECAGVTRGTSFGNAPAITDEMQADAPNWRLLLQIDTDDTLGVTWGDAGRLYFWMHSDDLRARAFERAWCIRQCY
jgi:uncharacterized protein YwqG